MAHGGIYYNILLERIKNCLLGYRDLFSIKAIYMHPHKRTAL